ncbi:MAG TPA: ATP-binding cassette domain-containing protein [Candidatus Dormibacteraeota bacterium]|nr:ATP-binding cassette domain-containing protein [Candidatus Dormibacteraeota bacterium]
MADAYVSVRELDFHYPDGTPALRGVNLEIGTNEFIAIIGQNGSGKTTLGKCLNGLLKPSAGAVLVDGLDTRSRGIVKKLATRVGYVFQNPDHQLFNHTVFKEIAYGPRNLGLGEAETRERVYEAARVAGVGESLFDEHPFFLTKGLRQRVAIASILAMRPRVLIVDEPTTGQDFRQSLEVMNFLERLWREEGHSIVIVTHEMSLAARYSRRTVLLGQGQVLADGLTREVLSRTDALARSDVLPTQVTRLAQRLTDLGVRPDVILVEELVEELVRVSRRRRRAAG